MVCVMWGGGRHMTHTLSPLETLYEHRPLYCWDQHAQLLATQRPIGLEHLALAPQSRRQGNTLTVSSEPTRRKNSE